MAKLKLLGDKIAVQAIVEKETKSGIVLSSTINKAGPKGGIVKYVGPGEDSGKMEVKVGDHIYFLWDGEPIKVDDEEYYIIVEDDVQLIIE